MINRLKKGTSNILLLLFIVIEIGIIIWFVFGRKDPDGGKQKIKIPV